MSAAIQDVRPYNNQSTKISVFGRNDSDYFYFNQPGTAKGLQCEYFYSKHGSNFGRTVHNDWILMPEYEDVTVEGNVSTSSLPAWYSNNIEKLKLDINNAASEKLDWYKKNESKLKSKLDTTANLLAELPFIKSNIELTQSENIKYTLLFPDDKLLLITQSLGSIEDLNDDEILFSFFVNRELIMSNVTETSLLVKGFSGYLQSR